MDILFSNHAEYAGERCADSTVVRAFAVHQGGPGIIPDRGVTYGLNVFMVVEPSEGFFTGSPVFICYIISANQ